MGLLLIGVAAGGGPAAAPAAAQDSSRVVLRGAVVDASSGQALPGASVVLWQPGARDSSRSVRGVATAGSGFYQFPPVRPGRYVLRASYLGYAPRVDTLRLEGRAAVIEHEVALAPAPEVLPEVRAVAPDEATRPEAGRQRIRPADIARVPTAAPGGDLAAYLQSLPGVVALGDRGGQLYVRGGSASQNFVLVDGALVYRPFHILGGFSAFPQEIVSEADFYAGGFPARYAERTSSVLDVTTRGGNFQSYEAAAGLSPLVASVRLEGPLLKDRLSLLAVARQSVLERSAPSLLGREVPLTFGDQFVKIQNQAAGGYCSLSGLHTYDRGTVDFEQQSVFTWQNYALSGRCKILPSTAVATADISVGLSYFSNGAGAPTRRFGHEGEPQRTSDIWRQHINIDLTHPSDFDNLSFTSGFHTYMRQLGFRLGNDFSNVRADTSLFMISVGGYVGAHMSLLDQSLDVQPSVAVTAPLEHAAGIQPRLRATWQPWGSSTHRLSAALGIYQQFIAGISDERDAGAVFTAWMPAPLGEGRPSSAHAILSWGSTLQTERFGEVNLNAEGYYKRLWEQPVPIWDTRARFTTTLKPATGSSYGADLRASLTRGPFALRLSYGYSRTRHCLKQKEFGKWYGTPVQCYNPPYDRRHKLSMLASLNLNRWTVDAHWQYGSGRPYTPPLGLDAFLDPGSLPDPRRKLGQVRFLFERPYGGRLPAYHRFDVSVRRPVELPFGTLELQAGAMNLYDRNNLFYFDLFTYDRIDQLPIVPYLSMQMNVP